jgi:hypothetical protein
MVMRFGGFLLNEFATLILNAKEYARTQLSMKAYLEEQGGKRGPGHRRNDSTSSATSDSAFSIGSSMGGSFMLHP